MKVIDSYKRPDEYECELRNEGQRWEVVMYDADGNVHWSLDRKSKGGRYEGGRIVDAVWTMFDEQLARQEFERWRN